MRLFEGTPFDRPPKCERCGAVVEKKVVVFLGWLEAPREIVVSEHGGFEWVKWDPPHRIERGTIDAALAAIEAFFGQGEATSS